jgi:hypothetical protein
MRAFQPIGGRNNPFGKKMTLEGGGKGGSAPDPNPGYIRSAEVGMANLELARESLDFYKQQYADMKPLYDKIVDNELRMGEANQRRADEYAAYERETFRPLEKKLVQDAYDYNTEAKREQLARQSQADVSQAFENVRGQQGRQMAAVGLRPDSNRFAALNQNLLTQEALARAGAANRSRTESEGLGYARLQDAASLGRNLASNASTAYGVAINANNAAGSNMQQSMGAMNQGYGTAANFNNAATSAYGTAGNIYGQEYNARMQGYQAQQQANSSLLGGIGNIAGRVGAAYFTGGFSEMMKRADGGIMRHYSDGREVIDTKGRGGAIRGPGGPVDDKIPAMLSDGEYVLPADTVQKIGVKKLDKIVKKTHTPAAEQRRKKALKGKK